MYLFVLKVRWSNISKSDSSSVPKYSKMFQKGRWYLEIPETHFFAIFATFHHFLSFPTNKSKFFFTKTFLNWIGNQPTQIIELLKSLKIIPYYWNEFWTNFRMTRGSSLDGKSKNLMPNSLYWKAFFEPSKMKLISFMSRNVEISTN